MYVLVVISQWLIFQKHSVIRFWAIWTIRNSESSYFKNAFVPVADRIRYGSDSAAGGWFFSHSGCRHLIPRPCCRLQWICHLRYQSFLQNCCRSLDLSEGWASRERPLSPSFTFWSESSIPTSPVGVTQYANSFLHNWDANISPKFARNICICNVT